MQRVGVPSSRWAQRARAMPPVLGVVAVAAYAANSVQAGAPCRTHSSRATEPSAANRVAGTATRAWPYRSTSRAVHGATRAVAASPVAVTAPARAYEPRVPAIITTALTLNMPMGSRAVRFPIVNARAPGVDRSRRYGPGGRRRTRGRKSAATRVSAVTARRGRPEWDGRGALGSAAAWVHRRPATRWGSNTFSVAIHAPPL